MRTSRSYSTCFWVLLCRSVVGWSHRILHTGHRGYRGVIRTRETSNLANIGRLRAFWNVLFQVTCLFSHLSAILSPYTSLNSASTEHTLLMRFRSEFGNATSATLRQSIAMFWFLSQRLYPQISTVISRHSIYGSPRETDKTLNKLSHTTWSDNQNDENEEELAETVQTGNTEQRKMTDCSYSVCDFTVSSEPYYSKGSMEFKRCLKRYHIYAYSK